MRSPRSSQESPTRRRPVPMQSALPAAEGLKKSASFRSDFAGSRGRAEKRTGPLGQLARDLVLFAVQGVDQRHLVEQRRHPRAKDWNADRFGDVVVGTRAERRDN